MGYVLLGYLVKFNSHWFTLEKIDLQKIDQFKKDFIAKDTGNPRLKGIQAFLREVSKLKFDETPDYDRLSKLLSGLDGGMRYYMAESKIKFMKAAY